MQSLMAAIGNLVRGLSAIPFLLLALAGFPAFGQVTFQSASQAYGVDASSSIAHVGAGAVADRGDCGSISPAIPAGSSGDVLIALVNSRETSATLSLSGASWTQLYADSWNNNDELQVRIYWRVATGTDTLTVTQSGTCESLAAQVSRFSGVDTSGATPFDSASPYYAAVRQNSDNLDTGTITTASAGAMLLVAGFIGDNRSTSEGAGWSESFDNALNLSTRDLSLSLHYQAQSSAGSKSVSNWDISNTEDNYGIIFALKPTSSGSGRSITIPMPSGVTSGDLLIATVSVRYHAATVTPPSGWTLLQDTPQTNGAASCDSGTTAGIRTMTYYKVAGASESAAVFGYSSTCNDTGFGAGGVLRFSGVDTSSPVVTSAESATASSTTHVAPAVTPGIADTMLVTVHSYGSSRSWTTAPAGMTERVDQRSYNADNARGTMLGIYTESLSGTGSTGTRSATGAGDADYGATHSLVLRPVTVSIGTPSAITEGNSGTQTLAFPVTLSTAIGSNVTVSFAAADATATAGASCGGSVDYVLASTSPLTITAGSTSTNINVTICGDTTYESDETFTITLSSPVNAVLGTSSATGTITNDDAAAPATCSTGTISGVVNTYYPGTASVSAGASTISVGSGSGAGTSVAVNDLVLIIQMQDASITTGNDSGYGAASAVNAGKYEYATVASVGSGTITLTSPLANSYTTAAYNGAAGQKTFQVIRVPVYSSATLGAATAKAWDGSSGGVLAVDVTGTLTLGGATVSVSGMGFRGGATRTLSGGSGTDTDYVTLATVNTNGSKGESIAGTPRYVFTSPGTVTNTGVEGYPNGSHARGSPANGGGGGSDGNPAANDQNTGGGGGGSKGAGGMGGIAWCPGFNAGTLPNYNCDPYGGLGGKAVAELAAGQLTLGGGGGGATSNNGTGSGSCDTTNGACSSGVAGGGVIMMRAATFSGSATFNANGSNADSTVENDGSGGGGGAGAVLLFANAHSGGTVTINASGGNGGTNLIPPASSGPHGPGGGGGGGYAVYSGVISASCTVNGGAAGVTYNNGTLFGVYGAANGSPGACVTTLTSGQMPGSVLGSGPCAAALHHYAVSYPLGNPGLTCEALAVRITAHDSSDGEVAPAAGTQITLSTAPAADGWALRTGNGTFTSPNKYTFDGTEKYAEFWLTETTVTTSPHIDIDVVDNSATPKTDKDGDASEDAKAQFADAAFKYYNCTGAVPGTCSEVSINTQIAGLASNVAPSSQTLYLRAVKQSTTTSACTGGLSGAQNVDFAYECDNPATCSGSNQMSINGGSATTIARNNNGTVSVSAGSYTAVAMTFDANGFAPFNLNFGDVGVLTLHARKIVAAGVGTPPSTAATLYGASNSFVVKPYSLALTDVKQTAAPQTANPAAADASGSKFIPAGEGFSATVTAVNASCAASLGTYTLLSSIPASCIVANYGQEATPETATLSSALAGGLGLTYDPGVNNPTAFGAFSGGSATGTTFSWDEVGIIKITPNIGDNDYLGAGVIYATTQSGNVGRFYPDHFGVTGSVVTRSDLQAVEAQATPFTYLGEPMKLLLAVTAYGKNNDSTALQNYAGSFAKLDATTLGTGSNWFNTGCATGTQCMGLGAVNGSTGLSGRLAVVGSGTYASVTNPASSWTTGVGTFTVHVSLARPTSTTPDTTWGAYDTLLLGAMPQDVDGATLPGSSSSDAHKVNLDATTGNTLASNPDGTSERRQFATTRARFGRIWLGNAYGSDQRDLTVSFEAQYWNGNAFVKNTADSLTSIASANIGLLQNGLTSTVNAGTFTVSSGAGSFVIAKPTGATLAGSVDIALALGSNTTVNTSWTPTLGPTAGANLDYLRGKWYGSGFDRDPTARATFGVAGSHQRKGPIYIRENY